MAEVYSGSAKAQITPLASGVLVHNLEGSGNTDDLLALFQTVRKMDGPVYISIDIGNPRMEQLMRVYQRFGAKPVAVVLEVC